MIVLKKLSIFLDDICLLIFRHYVKNNDRRYKKVKKLLDKIEQLSDFIHNFWWYRFYLPQIKKGL